MEELERNHNYTNESFENIKHIDEEGTEFWYARELMTIVVVLSTLKFHFAFSVSIAENPTGIIGLLYANPVVAPVIIIFYFSIFFYKYIIIV